MKRYLPTLMLVAITLLWVWTLWPMSAPVEFLGGDRVYPTVVRSGESITVIRNWRVVRSEEMRVTRNLVRCSTARNCDIMDLPSSRIVLDKGDYLNFGRAQFLPTNIQPGKWELVFALHWQNRLGRDITTPMQKLDIEVIQ